MPRARTGAVGAGMQTGRTGDLIRRDEFGRRLTAPVMVGRAGELEYVGTAVASPAAVIAVEGELGVGKTGCSASSPPIPA